MCYLCDPNNKDKWWTIGDETITDDCEGFEIVDDELCCTLEAGYSGAGIKINFCPICGRKLEHNEHKEYDYDDEEDEDEDKE